MELGGDPQKNDEYVHWRPIFYVCSSARNWVSFMYLYKGIYHIFFPLGSSNPGCLKFLNYNVSTKKQVPRNDQFLFILY